MLVTFDATTVFAMKLSCGQDATATATTVPLSERARFLLSVVPDNSMQLEHPGVVQGFGCINVPMDTCNNASVLEIIVAWTCVSRRPASQHHRQLLSCAWAAGL